MKRSISHPAPSTFGLAAAFAGALALLVPSGAALAQAGGGKKVAVFIVAKAKFQAEGAAMEVLLRKQLGNLTGVRPMTGSTEPSQSFESALGPQLENGYRLLNDKKGPEAEAVFTQALDTAKKFTGRADKRTLARLFKGLGVARALQGKLTAARDMIKASMNVWPDQTAPEYAWTIEVRDTFAEVETRLADDKKGAISIETEPPGAEVRVGGEVKGFTPLTVENIGSGFHYVQVQADGFQRGTALVKVEPGQEAAEAFGLKPIDSKSAWDAAIKKARKKPGSKKVMKKVLPEIKTIVGADGVLVLGLKSGKGGYVFEGYYINESNALLKRREVVAGDASAILEQLGRMISRTVGAPLVPEKAPVPLDAPPQASVVTDQGDTLFVDPNDLLRDPDSGEGDSVVDKWWFWTIVVVAVGGVAGLVVALATSEGDSQGPVGNVVLDLKNP